MGQFLFCLVSVFGVEAFSLKLFLFSPQHIVFTIKFLIAYVIPDTPADVKMALSRVSTASRFMLRSAVYKNKIINIIIYQS